MLYTNYRLIRLQEMLQEPWGDLRIPGLLDLLFKIQPKTILEIGSFRGVSTEVFLLHANHVTAVDPWNDDPEIMRDFQRRVGCYPHIKAIRGSSPFALPGGLFDLVYIDGDHSFAAVNKDIAAGLVRVRPGGWLAGHDYNGAGTPDVKRAVLGNFTSSQVNLFSDSSWAVQKEV